MVTSVAEVSLKQPKRKGIELPVPKASFHYTRLRGFKESIV